jgi:hypothetical protein
MSDEASPNYVCTLAPADLRVRMAQWHDLAGEELGRELDGTRLTVRYRVGSDNAERLRWLVAAERECCSFLSIELAEEPAALRLVISAPTPELLPSFG